MSIGFRRGAAWILVVALGWLGGGCGAGGEADLGPPSGWEGTPEGWWRAGTDTTGMFRDLETLESMGVAGEPLTYLASGQLAARSEVGRDQLRRAVKVSLIRLYRNEPLVVDSLFERFVTPRIEEASLVGDFKEIRDHFKQEGYTRISSNFQPPRTVLQLGKDVPVVYPDSLRARQVAGTVRMQVSLDREGVPVTIELLEGVHPVLDALALQATTQMRWRPAYLLRKGNWKPIPAWVRFNINFMSPPGAAE